MLLAGAGLAAHAAAWDAQFIFDDIPAIKQNASILSLSHWREVLWPPIDGSGVSGRPLVNLSLALNYAWGEFDPRGYHAFNLGAHILVAGLLYAVICACLRRVLAGSADCERSSRWLAFAAALLWVVHPLQTESVAMIIQRTEILGSLFYLLTLWLLVRGFEADSQRAWHAGAVLACLAGAAAKEIVFTAPMVALLIDRAFWSGSWAAAWRRHWRLYVGLVATWGLLAWIVWKMGGTRGEAAGFGTGAVPWWAYFLRQWDAITAYLKLCVWPHPLIVDYGCDVIWDIQAVAGQGVLLFSLGLVALFGVVRNRRWAVPLAAFFLILGPTSSVMPLPAQTMAEHRMYLPLAGVLVLLVLGAWRLVGRGAGIRLIFVVAPLALLSAQRSFMYCSPWRIWEQAVRERPTNLRGHFQLAEAYFDLGHFSDAATFHRKVLAVYPELAGSWSGLGNIAFRQRDFPEAIRCYERAIRNDARNYDAMSNLGAALFAVGRREEGLAQLRALVDRAPGFANGHFHLGTALLLSGQLDAARLAYETAIRLSPTLAEAQHNLGVVFIQMGETSKAERAFEEALRLKPDYPDAARNLEIVRSRRAETR
jgi:cytochrome c-type biogenesis protein CcmH/NrfG